MRLFPKWINELCINLWTGIYILLAMLFIQQWQHLFCVKLFPIMRDFLHILMAYNIDVDHRMVDYSIFLVLFRKNCDNKSITMKMSLHLCLEWIGNTQNAGDRIRFGNTNVFTYFWIGDSNFRVSIFEHCLYYYVKVNRSRIPNAISSNLYFKTFDQRYTSMT